MERERESEAEGIQTLDSTPCGTGVLYWIFLKAACPLLHLIIRSLYSFMTVNTTNGFLLFAVLH